MRIGQSKTRISGNSHPSFLPVRRNEIRALVILVIIYTAVAGVFSVRFLPCSNAQPWRIEEPSDDIEDPVQLPVIKPLSTRQEVVALKKEEMELVGQLLREFPDRDESLVIMGNLCYRQGDAVKALEYWNKALRINPRLANVYKSMALLYMKKGQFDDAVVQFRKALEIEPKLPDVYSNIGHSLMMSGRPKEAIMALQKEIQISPDTDFAYFLLGQAHLQQKEYQKAKEYYQTAIKFNPRYSNAYYGLASACAKLGESDKAKEYSDSFKKLKAAARKNLKGRKIEYDDFVETQKSAAITYINVGRMYRENGKLVKAEELLKQAAGLNPENVVCFLELATLYQLSKQPSKALQMYKKVRDIQPESGVTYLVIGILSAHLKRYDDSEEAFRKLITLAPQKSDGYRELSRLYLKTRQNLPLARQLAEKAVALEATAANYFVLSWAAYSNGDFVNALPAIKRAIQLDPDNKQYPLLHKQILQRK
ncbi:MAG: tetratricopeptide repeat protein [Planctomycetota bacterium]|jgi:tetratricopeptide (TPR) repeat protein